MTFFTSGDTPLSTSGDAAIDVLSGIANPTQINLHVSHKTANVDFQISFDGGAKWITVRGWNEGSCINLDRVEIAATSVKVRRVPGGTNITGIIAAAFTVAQEPKFLS
ncbi:MAG TPA: hypothetical protein VH370_01340 [Humisphaera sp.]|nr:hypothetical protein [Humisphaera sp.]